ncbi:serine hydrolase domain-containing protein [Anatilimnocola floriformis]|uniref:serine hydrolase domain-containing protein n=1 Tax=Anatilimnocola floriformis TaxID=2948575 RepID=UPI0020C49485|nr:serine hydrolase domain-containing protein [Anatilimnocola floriformis]
MQRRTFLQAAAGIAFATKLAVAVQASRWETAAEVLNQASDSKQIESSVLYVRQGDEEFSRAFGQAKTANAMFLLGSISKPISVAAVMTLYDRGEFKLADPIKKFLPAFKGDGRDAATIQHLLTHTSGLPDQVANNAELRKKHATLGKFAEETLRTPLEFAAGSKYQYSSMGILLATRIAEVISQTDIISLVERSIIRPLGMQHSAQGIGKFAITDLVPCQMEGAAPESGGGDPSAKAWNWNSPYWRKLGAPWGGTHCSAADVGRFLAEFLNERGAAIKPATARMMIQNHNPAGFTARGLGFHVGKEAGSPGCSEKVFGHTGSTGTLAWADPGTKTICVVLTSLPRRGALKHPREAAAEKVAAAKT